MTTGRINQVSAFPRATNNKDINDIHDEVTLVPVRPKDAGIDRKTLLSEMGDTSTPRRVNAAIPPNCLDAFLTNSPSLGPTIRKEPGLIDHNRASRSQEPIHIPLNR